MTWWGWCSRVMSSLHHWAELRARSVCVAHQVQRLEEFAQHSERHPSHTAEHHKIYQCDCLVKCLFWKVTYIWCQHVRSFGTTLFDAVLASLSNEPGRLGPQKICFTECSQRIAEGTEIIRWAACCYIQIQRQTCPGWEDEDPYASWALICNQKSGCERWCRPHAKYLLMFASIYDCLFHLVITGMMTCFKFLHIWFVYQTLQVMLNAPLLTLVRSCGTSAEILNHLMTSWKQRWLAFQLLSPNHGRWYFIRMKWVRGTRWNRTTGVTPAQKHQYVFWYCYSVS